MINESSIRAINETNFNDQFKKPLYESYCLSNIPNTIKHLFGIKTGLCLPQDVLGSFNKKYNQVVLIILDGFGWNLFEKYAQSSFLNRAIHEGIVSKLTTQFPSTTTSNITTITTGLPVGDSGVYEWFYYDPKIDDVICPLLYKRARSDGKLSDEGIQPELFLPHNNLFTDLLHHDIKSYVYQFSLYNKSSYSNLTLKNSHVVDFERLGEGLKLLKETLDKKERAYYYLYHSEIDTLSHEFGPYSKEAEIETLHTLELLNEFMKDCPDDVLVMVSADHGQTTVKKENAKYINIEFKEIIPYLKTNQKGEVIAPCGSFRDLFLHVKEEHIEEVVVLLREKLKGKAEVYRVNDLINDHLFGQKVSDEFLSKIGDVVILAYKDEAIWWYEENRFQIKHKGMHGGLVSEELEIPFIVLCK